MPDEAASGWPWWPVWGFGGHFILINQVGDAAFFWPLAFARAASSSLSFLAALGARAPMRLPVRLLPLVVGSAVLDVGGNAFFFLALRAGRLDVSAVLRPSTRP